MARTVKLKGIDGLEKAISDILTEYANDVTKTTGECVEDVTKAGVKALKQEANKTFDPRHQPSKGLYSTGWTSTFETGRLSKQGIIYNSKYPGLPHLLEYGHAIRGGGRTKARPHIAPVEEMVIKDFEAKLTAKL